MDFALFFPMAKILGLGCGFHLLSFHVLHLFRLEPTVAGNGYRTPGQHDEAPYGLLVNGAVADVTHAVDEDGLARSCVAYGHAHKAHEGVGESVAHASFAGFYRRGFGYGLYGKAQW